MLRLNRVFLCTLVMGVLVGFCSLMTWAYTDTLATQFPGDIEVTDLKLSGGDIVDSNETTRITIGSTNTIVGNMVFGSTTTEKATFGALLKLPASTAPRTNVTPGEAGVLIYNSTGAEVCLSTGATSTTWVRVSSPTVACQN